MNKTRSWPASRSCWPAPLPRSRPTARTWRNRDVSVLKGERHYLTGYDPINKDGTVNVVIEIPAGTTAKYETNKDTGMIELEQKNGAPRFVQYLGYPVNYGAIPRSVLLKSKGGDGDSVDVLVLGPAVPRGSVVRGRAIGVLALIDTGELDDKLVVVMENSPFAKVREHRRARRPVPRCHDDHPDVVHLVQGLRQGRQADAVLVRLQGAGRRRSSCSATRCSITRTP